MPRFLAYTSPARGHLYPIVPTLLELHGRGHEVHVRTLSSQVPALVQGGLYAQALDPAIEGFPLDDFSMVTPEEALAGGMRTFAARAEYEVPDLERAIAEVDPDVLLVDKTTAGATAVADAGSIPWAQWIPFFEHYSPNPGAAPEVSYIPFSLHPEGLEALNKPRRALGLAEFDGSSDMWRAELYLYLTAPPFEHDDVPLPANFYAVGPGIWEPPIEVPGWLDELEDPILLVTVSSEFQFDDELVKVALEALAGEDLRLVVTSAAHDPSAFDVPANARVERFVPHSAVLPRAACVLCHGGMGITQKALAAGVPVCVVPFGRDQFEVAGRVAAMQAGASLMPDALTPESLRSSVRSAMQMTAGARRMADGFARAGGPRRAADELERLVGRARVTTDTTTTGLVSQL